MIGILILLFPLISLLFLGLVWLHGLSLSLWYYAYLKDIDRLDTLRREGVLRRKLLRIKAHEIKALREGLDDESRSRIDRASYGDLGDRVLIGLFVVWALVVIGTVIWRIVNSFN